MRTVAILCLLFALPVAAQGKTQVNWWRGSWKEALAEAEARNVPILIAIIQEDEEANDRLVEDLFKDKKFVAAANAVVPIICNQKSHGTVKIDKGVGQIEVCKRFGATTCDRHIDHEIEMYRIFFEDKDVKTPQVMLCRPNLAPLGEIVDVAPASEYERLIAKSQKAIGPGLDPELFKASRELITRGRNHLNAKEYREAWDAVKPLVDVGGPALSVQKATEVQAAVSKAVDKHIAEAFKLVEAGRDLEALILLDDEMELFGDTPPAAAAKSAFDRIRKSKTGKVAAKDLARDKKLRPTLEKGAAFESKGEWPKARDAYLLVVSRGEGLPVAAKAKARLDYFESDPDIKRLIDAADSN